MDLEQVKQREVAECQEIAEHLTTLLEGLIAGHAHSPGTVITAAGMAVATVIGRAGGASSSLEPVFRVMRVAVQRAAAAKATLQ